MEFLEEIVPFLNVDARLDLQSLAVENICSLTGSADGREMLLKCPDIIRQLIILCQVNDNSRIVVGKDAALALINISGDEAGAKAMLLIGESSKIHSSNSTDNIIHVCFSFILDKENQLADPCCMILANLTRPAGLVDRIISLIKKSEFNWDEIIYAFAYADKFNLKGAKLHYLGPVLSNLSQSPVFRKWLTDRNRPIIQKLLPFTEYKDSVTRRGGVVATLKNCCFDIENHEWLLGPQVDILPHLLLPLAGPEEFDDEDNEKLPIDLQYLPETKTRELDPDIRIMLLEALCQLCATKTAREILREKNTYVILREYHKWEKDKTALLACENVVDILIKTEEEIGLDNLKQVDVPPEYSEKFEKLNKEFIQES